MQIGVRTSREFGVGVHAPSNQISIGLALLCTSYLLVAGSLVSKIIWDSPAIMRSVGLEDEQLPNFFGRYYRAAKPDKQVKFLSSLAQNHGMNRKDSEHLAQIIVMEAKAVGLDPILVAAVIKKESTFRKHVVSNRGAQGLMQVMPATGKYIAAHYEMDSFDARKLRDPSLNVRLGIRYLKYLANKYKNNYELALIAYNWGPGNLSKALRGNDRIPESTVKYARGVLKAHRNWRAEFGSKVG